MVETIPGMPEEFMEVITVQGLIDESEEMLQLMIHMLYEDILKHAKVERTPRIEICRDLEASYKAYYRVGDELIVLSAVNLQNKDVEHLAFVLAHEVWHHKQWEDGETFEDYITATVDVNAYRAQRIEEEADMFALHLFPNGQKG